MGGARYTSNERERSERALAMVTMVNGVIVTLAVEWFIFRAIALLPTLVGVAAYFAAVFPPSLWLLRRRLSAAAQAGERSRR